jgi:DNA helicase-2/ATP-dependent DNA helicase PcrA
MHSAKGLEFETVFLPGWEEGIFPSNKSIDENGKKGLEEERRLAYVGITRAKQNLYISIAMNRRIYGSYQNSTPSRFIDELPAENYEMVHNYGNYYRKLANQPTMKQILPVEKVIKHEALDMTKLRRGSRVSHTKFGKGIIVNIQDNFAEVAFERHSLKKVMIEYLELA